MWLTISQAASVKVVHKVVELNYSGEIGVFIIWRCEISSGFCASKIIIMGSFFAELFNIQKVGCFETQCIFAITDDRPNVQIVNK